MSACSASVDLRVSGRLRHGAFESVHTHGSSIEFDLVILIDAHDSVFKLRGLFLCCFGFRQINLNFRLVFLKSCRNDKKISRMMRISTSETMIMTGALRFRTANFMV